MNGRPTRFGGIPLVITSTLALVVFALIRTSAQGFTTMVLDDFEGGLRTVCTTNCGGLLPFQLNLWGQYPNDFTAGPDPGTANIVTPTDLVAVDRGPAHDGTHALHIQLLPRSAANCGACTGKGPDGKGNLYAIFFPNDGTDWHFMHEKVANPAGWVNNTYNRLRFWIKVPPQIGSGASATGQHNLEVGTYVHASSAVAASLPGVTDAFQSEETGGNHYYHHFDIPYTGAWHQVILDMHPNHQRTADPNLEWGDLQPANMPNTAAAQANCVAVAGLALGGVATVGDVTHPTCEAGMNYFDALTEFYIDFQLDMPNGNPPADFYIDGVELYDDTNPENTDQVYSVNAAFNPTTNKLTVGWNRRKNHDPATFEIRYAFSDIYSLPGGITDAAVSVAPGSPVTNCYTPCNGPYNTMSYTTTAIDVTGHNTLYIAIQPKSAYINGSATITNFPANEPFRQIVIPIPSTPTKPTNIRVGQ
jgi:hypothetical protein